MKKLNVTNSIHFIQTATDKEFLAYIAAHPFKNTVEPEIYQQRSAEISLAYIKKYGFDEATRCQIFKEDRSLLVPALLAWGEETKAKAVFKDFLAYGAYDTVKAYTETHECANYPEKDLFSAAKFNALRKLIKTQKLSPFAKLRVIMEGDNATLRTMIDSPLQNLDKREEDAFFTNATEENIDYWLLRHQRHPRYQTWQEMKIIRFGTNEDLENMIYQNRLAKDAEEFFFRYAPIELIEYYLRTYRPLKGLQYLFRYCKHTEVKMYLYRNLIEEDDAKFLLRRGNHDEIMLFIDKQHFNDENEVAFINRGVESEIMTYLRYYSLSDEAQLALVRGRNLTAISYFVNHYPLADNAYYEILKDSRLRGLLCPSLADTDE